LVDLITHINKIVLTFIYHPSKNLDRIEQRKQKGNIEMMEIIYGFILLITLLIGIRIVSLLTEIRDSNNKLVNQLGEIQIEISTNSSDKILHDLLYLFIGRFGQSARPLDHDFSPMWSWQYLNDDDSDWNMFNQTHKSSSTE
jgi:hypothetical protein